MNEKEYTFPIRALEKITCFCDGTLQCVQTKDYVSNGVVNCISCGSQYAIEGGILHMQHVDMEETVEHESLTRDKQAGWYDKLLNKRQEVELKPLLLYIGNINSLDIIEYGCGTGRFTLPLAKSSKLLVSSDVSLGLLSVLKNKLLEENIHNVALIYIDSTRLKLKENEFDLAVSFQVLEHIPHKWQRSMLYRSMYKGLRPKGKFFHSVYHFDLRRRILKKTKTGHHKDGIFYRFYTKKELNGEFLPYVKKLYFSFFDSHLPGLQRFVPHRMQNAIGKVSTKIPFVRQFSHLIVVKGVLPNKKISGLYEGVVYTNKSRFKKYIHWFSRAYVHPYSDHQTIFSYIISDSIGTRRKKGITSIVDLEKSLDELWQAMRKKFIQKQIQRGERAGILIRIDMNFDEFYTLYTDFRKQKKLSIEHKEAFALNGLLCSAYYNEKMIAAGVFIADGEFIRAWTLVSDRFESNPSHRELVGYANRMIIWHVIQYAKKNGFKTLDLGGLNVPSKNRFETSLNEFKEAFGGLRVESYFYTKVNSLFLKLLRNIKKAL